MWCPRTSVALLYAPAQCCLSLRAINVNNIIHLETRFLSQSCHNVSMEEKGHKEETKTKSKTKLLKVALIGRPNVGKSTLINQLVGRITCAVSMKAHTTKVKVKAFVNDGNTQLVFLDTPGLVTSTEIQKYKFDPTFLRSAEEAIQEADIVGYVHDASYTKAKSNKIDPLALRLLMLYQHKHSFLVLNKVDALKRKKDLLEVCATLSKKHPEDFPWIIPNKVTQQELSQHLQKISSWPYFREVFMVSALEGDGVGDIKAHLLEEAKPGHWLITDKTQDAHTSNPQTLAVDLVKAACLDYLPEEVPYQIECKLNYFEDYDEKCAVEVALIPKNKRHARMIINKIRELAAFAEDNLANNLEKACILRIEVKDPPSNC